jgi:glycosyltransferase involved in cell wall biosynthesis
MRPEVSIVVPVFNEAENLPTLVEAVRRSLAELEWELLLVNDGSTDRTGLVADDLAGSEPRLRVLHLSRNFGQTAALQAGFDHASAGIVVTMDGDLQNDPADIPLLLERLAEGYDLVAGDRASRQDRFVTRRVPSVLANRMIRWLVGIPIRDNGCSLKAYRRSVVQRLTLYSDMHRFLPALAAATSGARIAEVPVRHHPRRHGHSKYGLSRVWKVLADLITIKTIHSFRERPLALFAFAAGVASLVGLFFATYTVIAAVSFETEESIRALVFPAAALLSFGLSLFLLMLGLIAEVAVRERRGRQAPPHLVLRERAVG